MRLLAALLLALAVGCAKEEPPPEPGRLTRSQQDVGMAMCRGHAERVCSCAATRPSLTDACTLARSRPEALALQISLLRGAKGELNATERPLVESAASKIIQSCLSAEIPPECGGQAPPR